jgi:hypothetical protein
MSKFSKLNDQLGSNDGFPRGDTRYEILQTGRILSVLVYLSSHGLPGLVGGVRDYTARGYHSIYQPLCHLLVEMVIIRGHEDCNGHFVVSPSPFCHVADGVADAPSDATKRVAYKV